MNKRELLELVERYHAVADKAVVNAEALGREVTQARGHHTEHHRAEDRDRVRMEELRADRDKWKAKSESWLGEDTDRINSLQAENDRLQRDVDESREHHILHHLDVFHEHGVDGPIPRAQTEFQKLNEQIDQLREALERSGAEFGEVLERGGAEFHAVPGNRVIVHFPDVTIHVENDD